MRSKRTRWQRSIQLDAPAFSGTFKPILDLLQTNGRKSLRVMLSDPRAEDSESLIPNSSEFYAMFLKKIWSSIRLTGLFPSDQVGATPTR